MLAAVAEDGGALEWANPRAPEHPRTCALRNSDVNLACCTMGCTGPVRIRFIEAAFLS